MNGIEMPRRISKLPTNAAGYPVPWFVQWFDGKPDFRIADSRKWRLAVTERRCFLCGEKITGPTFAYVLGPMCAVNRTSAEPPMHRECAIYSARVCPFLTNPEKTRRETNVPDGTTAPAGIMIKRNPGVALVWITRPPLRMFSEGRNGFLFNIGAPVRTLWFSHGRDATRDEVLASIDAGCPVVRAMAQEEGPEAEAELDRRLIEARQLIATRDLLVGAGS